jgi:hypothetical protein
LSFGACQAVKFVEGSVHDVCSADGVSHLAMTAEMNDMRPEAINDRTLAQLLGLRALEASHHEPEHKKFRTLQEDKPLRRRKRANASSSNGDSVNKRIRLNKNNSERLQILSWNPSGFPVAAQEEIIIEITICYYLSFCMCQEFDNTTVHKIVDFGYNRFYVFPGLSAASRSSAVSISSQFYDQFLHLEFCEFGGVVVLQFDCILVCLTTIHFPNSDLGLDLLQKAIDGTSRMIRKAIAHSLIKAKLNIQQAGIKHILGADFNVELVHDNVHNTRKTMLIEWCWEHGFRIEDYLEDHEHTHIVRRTGHKRKIGFILFSDETCSAHKGSSCADAIQHLTESDHVGILAELCPCKLLASTCEPRATHQHNQQDVSLPRLVKKWQPNKTEKELFLEGCHALRPQVHTIHDFESMLLASGAHVKKKSLRCRDSVHIKKLCGRRNVEEYHNKRAIMTVTIQK